MPLVLQYTNIENTYPGKTAPTSAGDYNRDEIEYTDKKQVDPFRYNVYLATRYVHPLDHTIRRCRTTEKWYVRWYTRPVKEHDILTMSVRTFVQKYRPRLPVVNHNPDRNTTTTRTIEEVRTVGIRVHASIERHLNGYTHNSDGFDFVYRWLDRYMTSRPDVCPLRTEMMIRTDVSLSLAGVVDCILFDRRLSTNDVLYVDIIDWKVSSSICEDSPSFLLASLQLNTYKYILQRFYGKYPIDGKVYTTLHVQSMYIVVICTMTEKVTIYNVMDMQTVLESMCHTRIKDNV